ncbi:MAG: peptidoglycan-binding protein [Verrucomicrobiota bacterium]|nr:peptidoglycan-binding protein [Verrucomicrobiota bacterium]
MSLMVVTAARAESVTASVQQVLKDQGFYYGEVTGTKDADTTAAIRRYQIRNGLQITGELNAETRKSLGIGASAPVTRATPVARATPPRQPIAPRATPPSRDNFAAIDDEPQAPPNSSSRDRISAPPRTGYAPGPHGLVPETSGIFDGTPYEVAPPDLQRRVIVGAQSLLARQGYYRTGIDGVYGPGLAFALRTYQERFDIARSGRLDMETLAALGLLPGQQGPGITAPRRRGYRRSSIFSPPGERIYDPH